VKHPWGKGNQCCINKGTGPPGAREVGPNSGNKGISFKDYSSRMAKQNVTKLFVKHHLGEGNQFCINEGAGPPEARGLGPTMGNKGISFKDSILYN